MASSASDLLLEYQSLIAEQPKKGPRTPRYSTFQQQYKNDRVAFVHDCFTWPEGQAPAGYQDEILTDVDQYNREAVRGPHGIGKSTIAAWLLIHFALVMDGEDWKAPTTASAWRQLIKYLWPECTSAFDEVELADGKLVLAGELIGKVFKVIAVDNALERHTSSAAAFDNGKQTVVKIETKNGRVLTRTLNHPLWADIRVNKPQRRPQPYGKWVQAGDLRKGSVIAVKFGGCPEDEFLISDQEIKLGGYIIGDGCLSNGKTPLHQIPVRFAQEPGVQKDEFCQIVLDLGSALGKTGGRNNLVCVIQNKITKTDPVKALMLKWGLTGKTAHQKSFPAWVWQLNERQLGLFLSRLYSTDGWASATKKGKYWWRRIGYATVNKKLAEQVLQALLRFGIQAKICRGVHKKWGREFVGYSIRIHDIRNCRLFIEKIGIFGKDEALCRVLDSCYRQEFGKHEWQFYGLPEGYAWEQIKSVKRIRNHPTVGITVPKYHTYLTQFVEHNTHKWIRKLRWDIVGRAKFQPLQELMQLSLKLSTGEAMALASDQPESMEGCHADNLLFVFDEAKAIPDKTWDAIEGAFSTPGLIKVFAMSTPGDPEGRFYDIHRRKTGYEDWHVRHVTIDEAIRAGRIPADWVKKRKKQWGENSSIFKNRVLGEFASNEETGVIALSWVEAAIEYWHELVEKSVDEEPFGKYTTLSVDIGGGGGDPSVYGKGYGEHIIGSMESADNKNSMVTAGQIVSKSKNKGVRVIIDADGLGAVVYDRVREQDGGVDIYPFHGAGKSFARDRSEELEFINRRAEAWWKFREKLEDAYLGDGPRIALPPDERDRLIQDLTTPKWSINSRGKIVIESKEEIRKRLGRSPDYGDTAVMRFYNPQSLEVNFY